MYELVSFENNHHEHFDPSCTEHDGLACIAIDGYPEDENKPGEVVAQVWMTKHRDIIVDWHDNGYRMHATVLGLIEESKHILREEYPNIQSAMPIVTNGFADMLIRTHGADQQDVVLIEECSELQKALCKSQRRRKQNLPDNKPAIIEEMTHVWMSMQICMRAHGVTTEDITTAFHQKLGEYASDNVNGNI